MSILDAKKASHKALLIFSLILLVYSITFSVRNLLRYSSFKKEFDTQELMKFRLEEINSGYHKTIALMKSKKYWILEAKKELGYIHSSENVYKFYDEGKL